MTPVQALLAQPSRSSERVVISDSADHPTKRCHGHHFWLMMLYQSSEVFTTWRFSPTLGYLWLSKNVELPPTAVNDSTSQDNYKQLLFGFHLAVTRLVRSGVWTNMEFKGLVLLPEQILVGSRRPSQELFVINFGIMAHWLNINQEIFSEILTFFKG